MAAKPLNLARRSAVSDRSTASARLIEVTDGLLDLDSPVGYRIRRVHGVFQESWREFFGPLGLSITPVQGGIVMHIERAPGLTLTELARRLQIEAPTLHESLKRLIAAGLIRRHTKSGDRRAHALDLTPAGRAAAALVRTRIEEQEAQALSALSARERTQLAELLGRVLRNQSGPEK